MMKRRDFLASTAACAAGMGVGHLAEAASSKHITILHTNDTHSRIDPFSRGRYKGLGGVARRASLINKVRTQQPHTLLVDAGDIFQGTQYFNAFRGTLELRLMSQMKYDVATIGNHDFDLGADWFVEAAGKFANFPFVSSNLFFAQKGADKIIHPYLTKTVAGKKIGFFGLGIAFKGLVEARLHRGVKHVEPISVARRMVNILRKQEKCDVVVLLSHIGYRGFHGQPGDVDLAKKVPGIDLIIGGHTHTFLHKPTLITSSTGHVTWIFQVGHSGIYLGQIDLHFPASGGLQVKQQVHTVGH